MKNLLKLSGIIALLVLPSLLFSQNSVIILEYMKVEQGNDQEYLEVEREWKKIHQKKAALGISNGWQLWRNVYAGSDDPYQYITVNWYDNIRHSFEENIPGNFLDGLFTQSEADMLMKKTQSSRKLVRKEMNHQQLHAEGSKGSQFIIIHHMQVDQGGEGAYLKVENEVWKPMHEKSIELGLRSSWGVWQAFPFNDGQARFIAVDGYNSPEQMMTEQEKLSGKLTGLNWDEISEKTLKTRETSSTEVWQLVDSVFPGI